MGSKNEWQSALRLVALREEGGIKGTLGTEAEREMPIQHLRTYTQLMQLFSAGAHR